MGRFTGRAVLVTGAAQGIGRAVVERFLGEGAQVVAADIDDSLLRRAAQELGTGSAPLVPVGGDISRREDVQGMVRACIDHFGRLDVLVANASIADQQPFLEIDEERWRRVLDINLTGTFFCIQEAARAMAPQGGGSIVVTSSTNAFWMETHHAAYSTSKAGQIGLVRNAALDLGPLGIRVNAVEPSVVRTRLSQFLTENPVEARPYLDRVPLDRFCEPQEVADAILFLASEEAGYITGQALILDGGLTLGVKLNLPDRRGGR